MLVALDRENIRAMAKVAIKGQTYHCPECGKLVILKQGAINQPYYGHYADSGCEWGKGETERHYEMKMWAADTFSRFDSEIEAKLGNHRTDCLLQKMKVVVEVQHTPISKPEWERRNRDYNNMGYAVLWVWDWMPRRPYEAGHRYLYNTVSKMGNPTIKVARKGAYDLVDVVDGGKDGRAYVRKPTLEEIERAEQADRQATDDFLSGLEALGCINNPKAQD